MEFAKEWSKETPCLIEAGECVRECNGISHNVRKLSIKAQPSSWKALGYSKSKIDGSYMAVKDDKENPRILVRVTRIKDGKALYSEVLDTFKEKCEALLESAKNGLMCFYDKVRRCCSDWDKDALLEAIREVVRRASDYELATIRQVFSEIQGDEEAVDLFWEVVNDDIRR